LWIFRQVEDTVGGQEYFSFIAMYNRLKIRHAATALILLWFPWTVQAGELQSYNSELSTPALALQDSGGKTRNLTDYRGQVVLVNFWASWCPPCIHEMPVLERLRQKLHDQPFEILAVNVGEPKYRVWKFVKLISFGLPVLLDSRQDTFRLWGGSVLPTSFLLDRQGRIRYQVQGDLEWDSEDVVSLIEKLINEQENKP
jgi:thiol-disulfide isomerase/thioredoxin